MSLAQTVRDIKDLKIQGAQHIAFSALDALREVVLRSHAHAPRILHAEIVKAKRLLDEARPTEPLLRNYTAGVMHDTDATSVRTLKESLLANIARLRKEHRDNFEHIVVTNTEARPLYQGRTTAKELADAGIPVHHFVDSAVHEALHHADIMFIGADAITPYAVINKVGSKLFAEVAKRLEIPVYVVTHALKFDPMTIKGKKEPIESRPSTEVWDKPP